MKPLSLLALLLFVTGTVWVFTWSERTVRQIQETYYATISPFLKGGSKLELAARAFLEEAEHSQDLERRIQAVELEFGKLRIIESQYRELERENEQLRGALNFRKRIRFDVVPARVIKRKASTWLQNVTIDLGEKSGIGAQVPVLAAGGLAGKIDQVFPGTDVATVILLTDEACQVSVKVAGTPEVGIVSGQRGSYGEEPRLRLRYLSKNAPVRPGMKVVTTGRGRIFPPDITVGTIESFEPGAVDSEALVKPAVDFRNLEFVFVVGEFGESNEE